MKKINLLLLIYASLFFGILTTQAQSLSVAATVINNVNCYGGSNGSIFAYTSGGTTPYTYLWSPGAQTNQTVSSLSAATYTVQVTDLLGNTSSSSATISQPAALTISASSKYGTVCAGMPDSLFSEATGGVTPYKYTWSGAYGDISCPNCPNTSAFPYGQAYLLTAVFDYNGCTATASVNITVHTPPLVNIAGPINPIAPSRNDTLVASALGATSYLWSNSATTSSIIVSPSSSTTYSVTAVNMYGCYDTASYTVDTNTIGDGKTSGTAIRIVPNTNVTKGSFSSLDSVVFFTFVASDSNMQIISYSAYLGISVPHVHRLTLFDNSLNMLVDEPMPDITGANQIRLDISHLHIGNTYYVRASRCPAHANMPGCNPFASGECNASQRWDFQMCFRTVSVFVPQDSGAEPPAVSQLYYESRGQIADLNDIPRFDIKAYTNFACPAVYSSDSAVSFVYSSKDSMQRIDMVLAGTGVQPSQPVFKMEEDSNAGYLNYFKEFAPNGVSKIEGYSRLVYKNIYSNVDMHIYSNNVGTKLYFVCNPTVGTTSGGNPANIELQFKGATSVSIGVNGGLNVVTELGTLSFAPGFAYTDSAGIIKPKSWQAYFISVNSNTVRFNTGTFNSNEPLIIQVDRGHINQASGSCNKNLCWSTFYGGINLGDTGTFTDVTHDASGNVYAVGYTTSVNFPVLKGIQKKPGGDSNMDAVAVMFAASNYARNWATYYGGSGNDIGYGIVVDAWPNVYITGSTNSADLPIPFVYNGGYLQSTGLNGTGSGTNTDAFIAKISFGGTMLTWSTWYGGPGNEAGHSIAIDTVSPRNNLYVVGYGDVNTPLYDEPGSYYDSTGGTGLILKFNDDGLRKWATLIGGSSAYTSLNGCAVDANNNLLVTGTADTNYPLTGGGFSYQGQHDAVVTKFNTSNAIVWSTYYGGDGEEYGYAIATDAAGNAYITGRTESPYLTTDIELAKPHSWSYYQSSNGNGFTSGAFNAYIAEFSPSGSLEWGTYFGGPYVIDGQALTLDANNNLYLTGFTQIYGFVGPANEPANAYTGSGASTWSTAYLAAFNAGGGYYWGAYIGGNNTFSTSAGYGITAYGAQNLYVVGCASIYPFPFVNPGAGAWFQDTILNLNVINPSTIPTISEFNLTGITTGTNEVESKSGEVKVYPNPTKENITVQMDLEQSENVEYIIYNLLGEPVYSDIVNEPAGAVNKQISLSSLSNGNYIMEVRTGDNIYHAKITKLQ